MRLLLSLALLCSLSSQVLAGNDTHTYPETLMAGQEQTAKEDAIEKVVQQVKADYAAINEKKLNLKILKIEEGTMAQDCGTAASATIYNATGSRPEKIERWLAGDATEELTEYYYKAGTLFFIYRKQVYYPPATGAEAVEAELRIYLDKGKPVKYISSQGDTYQTMDFKAEVNEGNALYKVSTKEQLLEVICPAEK